MLGSMQTILVEHAATGSGHFGAWDPDHTDPSIYGVQGVSYLEAWPCSTEGKWNKKKKKVPTSVISSLDALFY